MILPVLMPASQMLASTSKPTAVPHKRPRGLWKARVTPRYPAGKRVPERQIADSDTDNDDAGHDSDSSGPKKQRRYPSSSSTISTDSSDDEVYYWNYSRECSPRPERVSNWTTRAKIMDTSSTATRGTHSADRETCDFEDWEDLKELFAKAAEQYENDDASEALPLFRGVIHECHRFLLFYKDPSVLFTTPPHARTQEVRTSSSERTKRDWSAERSNPSTSTISPVPQPSKEPRKCKCAELPTAFHAIFGTALFLFGNLIAQEPSLALDGEPNGPAPYWLAALDVFETGESLPGRTSGRGCEAPEDWRMAIVWGRTLVCIADETVTRALRTKSPRGSTTDAFPLPEFSADEPNWPPESPFSAIAARRPPVTSRMSLSTASPHELMMLAMDHFSRGIFHMPHPQHLVHAFPPSASGSIPAAPPIQESFSRAKELFTIASEVLLLAEKLEVPSERQYWASWADSVFNQMKMEADMDAWRGPITRARGRCWLIVGSARVEEIEAALERNEMEVLQSEEAQEARDGLAMAIEFFERAKGSATASSSLDPESHELQPLLAEALLTLANLTVDENKREELYARAQAEGGDEVELDNEKMDED